MQKNAAEQCSPLEEKHAEDSDHYLTITKVDLPAELLHTIFNIYRQSGYCCAVFPRHHTRSYMNDLGWYDKQARIISTCLYT